MAKLNFEAELEKVREQATHRAVKKFLKKRKMPITLVRYEKGRTVYYSRRNHDKRAKQYPICVVVKEPEPLD